MKIIIISSAARRVHAKLSVVIISIVCLGLTGCLTSPFYSQKFSSRSDEIPFTVWTFDKTKPITIECAKALANGNPFNGPSSYQHVTTILPDNQGMLDANGLKVYVASTKKVLPASCWRYFNFPDQHDYITVIRVLQDGSDTGIYTFDKPGLECLGKWNGKGANWLGWFGHNCNKKYINTGGDIRTVFLKAKW
jgi:hypothetical protein